MCKCTDVAVAHLFPKSQGKLQRLLLLSEWELRWIRGCRRDFRHPQLLAKDWLSGDAGSGYLRFPAVPRWLLRMQGVGEAGQHDRSMPSFALRSFKAEHIVRLAERDDASRSDCLDASRGMRTY